MQSVVAQKVAAALKIEVHLAETKRIAKQPTYDPEAYDLYLRGRYLLNNERENQSEADLVCFEQATANDPRFALGHAGITDACILDGGGPSYATVAEKARALQPWSSFWRGRAS